MGQQRFADDVYEINCLRWSRGMCRWFARVCDEPLSKLPLTKAGRAASIPALCLWQSSDVHFTVVL